MIQVVQTQMGTPVKAAAGKSNDESSGTGFGSILEQSKRQLSDAVQPESATPAGDAEKAETVSLVQDQKDTSADIKKKLKSGTGGDILSGTQIQMLLCGGGDPILLDLSAMPALAAALQQKNMAGSEQADAGGSSADCNGITLTNGIVRNEGAPQNFYSAPTGITQTQSAEAPTAETTLPGSEQAGAGTTPVFADSARKLFSETGAQECGKAEVPQKPEKDTDIFQASGYSLQEQGKTGASADSSSQIGQIAVLALEESRQPAKADTTGNSAKIAMAERDMSDAESLDSRQVHTVHIEPEPGAVTKSRTIPAGKEVHFEQDTEKPSETKVQKADVVTDAGGQTFALHLENVSIPEAKTTLANASSIKPVFEQVAQKITQSAEKAAQGGDYVFDMKLFPEGLGKVEVRMVCGNGNLALTVTAHLGEAGKLLSGQADELRAALSQNYQISALHIRVENKADVQNNMAFLTNGFGTPGRSASGGGSGQEQLYRYGKNDVESDEPYVARRTLSQGVLDARV